MGGNAGHAGHVAAEMSVIGCLAMDSNASACVYDMLSPEMFSDSTLGELFAAAVECRKAGAVDAVTITAKVGSAAQPLILKCGEMPVSIKRAADYANIVREGWRLRTLGAELIDLAYRAGDPGVMMKDILPEIAKVYDFQMQIESGIREQSALALKECISEWLHRFSQPPDTLKTGFSILDNFLGGFQRQGLYVLSARPGQGKTDFALNLAVRMSRMCRVNYNTLEMTRVECTERIIANLTGINGTRLRNRQVTAEEQEKIAGATEAICNAPLVIDEQEKITAAEVKSKILKHRPEIIVLDNLQNMSAMKERRNQWEAIAETTTMLKQIAKKYNVVILLLVQESREGGRSDAPTLEGLRGGSQIEADADGVMFLRSKKKEGWLSGNDYIETKLHIVKHRHGGTGVCEFQWQPQYHRYTSVDRWWEGECVDAETGEGVG